MKKYLVQYHAIKKSGGFAPITDLQLEAIAEKTRLEFELKLSQASKNSLPEGEASKVIIKCL